MTVPARETAAERVHRVLAEVLWFAEHEPEGPTWAQAVERFGVDEATLRADLELASMIGADSDDYLDMPVSLWTEGDEVHVTLLGFDRPLRLTPAEALALVVSGAAGDSPSADGGPDDALGRALAKVATLLDVEVGEQLDIDLGLGDPSVVSELQRALDDGVVVEIDHIRGDTEQRARRVVEPWDLFRDGGAWYLSGFCRSAGAERVFRVDRVVAARALDEAAPRPAVRPPRTALRPDADAPRLVIDLDLESRWVVESHPTEAVEERGDGGVRATLVVTSPAWAERLLLRLGPTASVVHVDPPLDAATLGRDAARRVLARYGAAADEH